MGISAALAGQLELIRQSTDGQEILDIWGGLVQNHPIAELITADPDITLGTMQIIASIKRPIEEEV